MALQSSQAHDAAFKEARRLVRAAINEAKARMSDLSEDEPPTDMPPRAAAEHRIRKAFELNLAGSVVSAKRDRAAISFVRAGKDFEGVAASGVVLMRREFNFRKNAKTETCPAIVLTSHAMQRLVERDGASDLDEFISAARPILGWSEVARQAGVRGDFLVPTDDGLWICTISKGGLIDTSGRKHDVAALKTFIDNKNLMPALATIRSRLVYYGKSASPSFPLVDGPGSKELIAMSEMAAAGAERQARNLPDTRRTPTPSAMGF